MSNGKTSAAPAAVLRRSCISIAVALFAILPRLLTAQTIRGRALDSNRRPLTGALIEVRDTAGRPLQTSLTSPTGAFQVTVPAPGRFLYRIAAIGYQPLPPTPVDVPQAGVILPDVILTATVMRLPDLVAVGGERFCGESGVSDDIFAQLLESARTALQIIETTIRTQQVGFRVVLINTRTRFGGFNNGEIADTAVEPLSQWPVQSIDPDTLRVVGFSRLAEPGNENSRWYYGPDARVLFSDWFLESHCFTVDKPKNNRVTDTLRVRFTPIRKTALVDVAGELVLDAHDLALLRFSFALRNLPEWLGNETAGGDMQFSQLPSGLWIAKSWSIWAPIETVARDTRRSSIGGQVKRSGRVVRVFSGRDTINVVP